jgi:hypothetical protein
MMKRLAGNHLTRIGLNCMGGLSGRPDWIEPRELREELGSEDRVTGVAGNLDSRLKQSVLSSEVRHTAAAAEMTENH